MPNRLADETSPYLLQHAENPVDWYPWGEEAFAKARAEDRPILLSVGYSSCHWCHVMAHESFENETIAGLMNEHFVNIKVDREERPDIDSVYMGAVQAMTGQGGWPMTVFMTPGGEPFYAGTYFPPDDAHGRPGFPRVLEALHNAWLHDRPKLLETTQQVVAHLEHAAAISAAEDVVFGEDHIDAAMDQLRTTFDADWGGFGGAPKFPVPGVLESLLAHHARAGADPDDPDLAMVLKTLRMMWSGGIYDHLGGGFSRYSVDARWVVPHFEKMLYDNAQLAVCYAQAYQLTKDEFFASVLRETLDYLVAEMLDASGGFYSAQDADSEGIEGKFFVWTPEQLREAAGDLADLAIGEYSVTPEGNFFDPHHPDLTGRSVLTRRSETPAGGDEYETLRRRLKAVRDERIRPGLDDKVLTSWNGLALRAFAYAYEALGDQRYQDVALANARFVRDALWAEGRLLHSWKDGQARIPGMLEDYAYYGLGLVELYRATGDRDHLEWARELLEVILSQFADETNGGFFDTAADGESLIVRPKSLFDASVPSGNGAAAQLCWLLGRYYGRTEWEQRALDTLAIAERGVGVSPTGFGSMLLVAEHALAARRELVTVGAAEARAPLDREAFDRFDPHLLFAPTAQPTGLPHFEGRDDGGAAAAYLCRDMVCNLPVHTAEELRAQLDAG